ncbi:hypothetical protein ACU686_30900 [Yinghuangia aomiensis]
MTTYVPIVLTGSGDKAFCTGIDRWRTSQPSSPFMMDDPMPRDRPEVLRPVEAGHRRGQRHWPAAARSTCSARRVHHRERERYLLRPAHHLRCCPASSRCTSRSAAARRGHGCCAARQRGADERNAPTRPAWSPRSSRRTSCTRRGEVGGRGHRVHPPHGVEGLGAVDLGRARHDPHAGAHHGPVDHARQPAGSEQAAWFTSRRKDYRVR